MANDDVNAVLGLVDFAEDLVKALSSADDRRILIDVCVRARRLALELRAGVTPAAPAGACPWPSRN